VAALRDLINERIKPDTPAFRLELARATHASESAMIGEWRKRRKNEKKKKENRERERERERERGEEKDGETKTALKRGSNCIAALTARIKWPPIIVRHYSILELNISMMTSETSLRHVDTLAESQIRQIRGFIFVGSTFDHVEEKMQGD